MKNTQCNIRQTLYIAKWKILFGESMPKSCINLLIEMKHILILIFALTVEINITGCISINNSKENLIYNQQTRATNVSRTILSANGGQTIILPQLMSDVQTLWSPLTNDELKIVTENIYKSNKLYNKEFISWITPSDEELISKYIYRFTKNSKEITTNVISRANEYIPIIISELNRNNLPQELACLPFIESAFEPKAVSQAGAAGLWQLMPETAKRFGLLINDKVDERFNVEKSTTAAILYLNELYKIFHNWPLAIAAYNAGEGTIQKAIRTTKYSSLHDITSYSLLLPHQYRPLKEETLQYLPKFIAAIHIIIYSNNYNIIDKQLFNSTQNSSKQINNKSQKQLELTGSYDQPKNTDTTPRNSRRIF